MRDVECTVGPEGDGTISAAAAALHGRTIDLVLREAFRFCSCRTLSIQPEISSTQPGKECWETVAVLLRFFCHFKIQGRRGNANAQCSVVLLRVHFVEASTGEPGLLKGLDGRVYPSGIWPVGHSWRGDARVHIPPRYHTWGSRPHGGHSYHITYLSSPRRRCRTSI